MRIHGKKVSLTRVTEDDLDFISMLECNMELWLYEEEVYIATDPNAVRDRYLKKMDSSYAYDFVIWTLVDDVQVPIGLAQMWSYNEHRKSWELGFAILQDYQGHGYGTEAIKLLLDYAFEQLQAHKVVGMCNSNNVHSAKLMERVGMRREGTFREELFWNKEWHDQHFYSILESEYK
ncbi:GNAT family N-acetyltransferase [Paenibacillus sp. N1-5-1-14]|uniref:GNAT family N-acetyltransferase n=1 Tax=Paenibacillus radicibacter TaxID=2972488 RepID=UPI002158A8FC|nr:GNAT family protein [Paenibacillus radicibacter]MCR8644448.1 GNAT family N-acetyltransferase [Paenibacillus radicibacter]